jgi:RING finger protein 113A
MKATGPSFTFSSSKAKPQQPPIKASQTGKPATGNSSGLTSTTGLTYEASKSAAIDTGRDDLVATLTTMDRDLYASKRNKNDDSRTNADRVTDKQLISSQDGDNNPLTSREYHGKSNYHAYLKQGDTVRANASSAKSRLAGPQRSVSNLRSTTRVDYAPDICKDYAETGFCGFGDSCKFAHIRGDYKSGWEIDQEWEAMQQRDKNAIWQESDSDKYLIRKDPELVNPEQCLLCARDYQRPVLTRECKHKFCEACFLREFKKCNQRCPLCQRKLSGQVDIVKK